MTSETDPKRDAHNIPAPRMPVLRSEPSAHARLRLYRNFPSKYVTAKRDVIIYVPPEYEESPERLYPVLYMQDGQNLFDPRTSFVEGRTWEMRQYADEAIEAGELQPLIIVGIYNTGERRIAEYTPEPDRKMGGGEAEDYGLMLTRELMPWVARNFRLQTGRNSTGVGGSSLGGLVALYLGLRHPAQFGKLAVLSPSVWWNNKSILGYVNERSPEIWERPRIWLDVGDREGKRALADVEALNRRLRANGWRPEETLHFERIHGGTHDEAAWARRVRPMLTYLFPAG